MYAFNSYKNGFHLIDCIILMTDQSMCFFTIIHGRLAMKVTSVKKIGFLSLTLFYLIFENLKTRNLFRCQVYEI